MVQSYPKISFHSLQRRSDVDPGAQFKRFLDRLPTRARIVLLLLEQEYLQEFMFTVCLFMGSYKYRSPWFILDHVTLPEKNSTEKKSTEKNFGGQNLSTEKIVGTNSKNRQFCPPKLRPISYLFIRRALASFGH